MTEREFWDMHPRTFNACQRQWCKANGVETKEDVAAEMAVRDASLLAVLNKQFGAKIVKK